MCMGVCVCGYVCVCMCSISVSDVKTNNQLNNSVQNVRLDIWHKMGINNFSID